MSWKVQNVCLVRIQEAFKMQKDTSDSMLIAFLILVPRMRISIRFQDKKNTKE